MLYSNFKLKGQRILTLLALTVFLFSCSTGSYILTGQARAPIDPSQVTVYLEPPAEFETIGIVESSSGVEFSSQKAQDRTIRELKEQAAKIGANGVLLSGTGSRSDDMYGMYSGGIMYAGSGETKTAKGQAIYVIRE